MMMTEERTRNLSPEAQAAIDRGRVRNNGTAPNSDLPTAANVRGILKDETARPIPDREALFMAYGALLALNEQGRCDLVLAAIEKTLKS